MIPIIDRREALGDCPALHALIIGVSAYPHLPGGVGPQTTETFGFRQLSSAAVSAVKLHRWLVDHSEHLAAPLGTSRLLLSPSPDELAQDPEVASFAGARGTLDSVLHAAAEWRADARAHPGGVALLYLAGLGLEHPEGDQLLLLEGFGDGIGALLRNSVSLSSLVYGMAPSPTQNAIARTQLYIFDSSRRSPGRDEAARIDWTNFTPVFDPHLVAVDDRASVTIYGAAPGTKAFGVPARGTILVDALIRCLGGNAAQPIFANGEERWAVTVSSLVRTLQHEVAELSRPFGREQQVRISGSIHDAPLVYLDDPPLVDLTISVSPAEARTSATLEMLAGDGTLVLEQRAPLGQETIHASLPAGAYMLRLNVDAPTGQLAASKSSMKLLTPPHQRWNIDLSE